MLFNVLIPDYCGKYSSCSYRLLKRDSDQCYRFIEFLIGKRREFLLDNLLLQYENREKIKIRIGSAYRAVLEFYIEFPIDTVLALATTVKADINT